jgi:hypothetical protein
MTMVKAYLDREGSRRTLIENDGFFDDWCFALDRDQRIGFVCPLQ